MVNLILFIDDSLAKDVYTDVIKDSKGAVLVNYIQNILMRRCLKSVKGLN